MVPKQSVMENLPVEMIVKIMQYLHPKDIGKLSESSKYMNYVVKKNRKTHIYELPDEVLEKIFGYVERKLCLEGLKNTRLQKFIPQLPYKITTNSLYGTNNYNSSIFRINYDLVRTLNRMKIIYD